MAKRAEHSMLLILSPEQNAIVRESITERLRHAPRMSMRKRWLCAMGASVLVAFMAVGLVKAEQVIAIGKWVALVFAL